MGHSTIAHNALRAAPALVAALLLVALLAAPDPAAAFSSHKHSKPKLTLEGKREQYVEIKFYVNVTIGLDAFFVLQPLAIPPTVTGFGGAIVVDSVVTSGPGLDSQPLGTAKGFYVLVNADNATGQGIEDVTTVIFNEASGFGAGSTISYRGYGQLPDAEFSITGGTGKFRLARGWAVTSTEGVVDSLDYFLVNHIFYYDI